MSSAAVVIGALRVKFKTLLLRCMDKNPQKLILLFKKGLGGMMVGGTRKKETFFLNFELALFEV